jgi:hypothetical protein
MRHAARVVLTLLAMSLLACDVDLSGIGLQGPTISLGPPPRDLPSGVVRFEPRSLSLRMGETADVTLRFDPRLRSLVLQWWGRGDFPIVTVERGFDCEPEASCGLVRYEPAERAVLQLQDGRVMHIRVTAIAEGRNNMMAYVNTCVPAVAFCQDIGSDSLLVEVRP